MRRMTGITLLMMLTFLGVQGGATAGGVARLSFQEYLIPSEAMAKLNSQYLDHMLATYPAGSWAPMKWELGDGQLALMGLPSKKILTSQRYPTPTMIDKFGRKEKVDPSQLPSVGVPTGTLGPTVATFAGAGWFGIRPGALLLLITPDSIGWCSMAHVYGTPGSYKISTAGHCGKRGDVGTVIAAFGNRNGALNPILLDFGSFTSSTDGGLGNDYALITVNSAWQNLVTPTMAFWGGPRGSYTKTGDVAAVTVPNRGLPSVTVTPDPFLAQTIVHYGHGAGVGAGGTPRAGETISWRTTHYMFFGAISPGDSGSGANTLTGDSVGANMEAAGIMTHLYIDLLMKQGLGVMGGTRVTKVGTPANGQIVPYPIPVSGLP